MLCLPPLYILYNMSDACAQSNSYDLSCMAKIPALPCDYYNLEYTVQLVWRYSENSPEGDTQPYNRHKVAPINK